MLNFMHNNELVFSLVTELPMPDISEEYPDSVDAVKFWDHVDKGVLFRSFMTSTLLPITFVLVSDF